MKKYAFTAVFLSALLVVSVGLTALYVHLHPDTSRDRSLLVVTSFYPMYIAAENVIGEAEGVVLENLSEPQTGCLHDFQLTPQDMVLLSGADVFIVNGGGIETFMQSIASAYPELQVIEACSGIALLQDEEEENAHAWMSICDYRAMVETMAEGLAAADPAQADTYRENAACYCQKLQVLEERQEQLAEQLAGTRTILFHEAFAYVADAFQMPVSMTMDLDEERQTSAGEVAEVLQTVQDGASVILAEERYGKDMAETVQAEVDVKVLYLDPLTRGDYDPDSYLNGMNSNLDLLESLAR